ncbi:MAG: hypothetical protein KF795_25910 [Labilithrix sp.]|nr:hypothetical protein [Labilithrix sp.]
MHRALLVVVFVALALGAALFGCADSEAPPYDELSLRDALRADPRSMETVPAPMKAVLAERYEREAEGATGETRVEAATGRLSARELVARIDDERRAEDFDAWVLAKVELESEAAIARPLSAARADDAALPALPAIEGEPAPDGTRDAEGRALRGRAGAVLRRILAESGASRVVRVSGWPVGAVVVEDTLYVNGSWLVSMAAIEDGGAADPEPGFSSAATRATPATLRGNPYATFTTLASCIADVMGRCEGCRSSGACDESATLDFPDGRSECLFLLEDARRAEQLCVLALTSIATVAECVKADGCVPPTGATTIGSLGAAEPFLAKEACVRSLNLCLSGTNERREAPPNGAHLDVKVEGCSDPFRSCASFFGGLTQACEKGKCNGKSGPSCRSCNGCQGCTRCSGCSSDSRSGEGSGYGSGGTGEDPSSSASSSGGSGTSSGGSGSSSGSTGSSGTSSGSTGSSGTSSGSSGSSGTSASSSSGSASSSSSGGSSGGGSSSSSGGSSSGGSSSGCGGGSSGGCSSCKGCSGGSSGGCGKCEEAPEPAPEPESTPEEPSPLGPASTLAWLLAPLVFLGKRARRAEAAWRAANDGHESEEVER